MTFSLNELILYFTGLVAIFSPGAAIAPYIGVAGHYGRKFSTGFLAGGAVFFL